MNGVICAPFHLVEVIGAEKRSVAHRRNLQHFSTIPHPNHHPQTHPSFATMTRDEPQGMWIIGYGSLIFKPPPHTSRRITGVIQGYIRRFWQSSNDHRGTREAPGRVATLISLEQLVDERFRYHDLLAYEMRREEPCLDIDDLHEGDLKVCGCAYFVEAQYVEAVRAYLDLREQNGYSLHRIKFYLDRDQKEKGAGDVPGVAEDEGGLYIESSVYIGGLELESFVGPERIEDTADVIRHSIGPSGKNIEYLVKLVESVRELGHEDRYLEDLLRIVEQ
ncbi:uncharacterized protein LODBEIA_P49400 [Lodderomyces beijingensis]|uniref:glutathione-specific gamma-glutamylcyclotransferase n=1 Tax=Lodderomyces beijingensis TaxID=1775926 RepID=A0ABP0ZUA6_9ASCO